MRTANDPFPPTLWTQIRRAREGDRDALEAICARYRPPIVAYLGGRGVAPADAEDLAQQLFLTVLTRDLLLRADAAKGRFRCFLLGVCKNIVREASRFDRRARRDRRRTASLEAALGPDREAKLADLLAAREDDEGFDALWARQMLELALEKLERTRSGASPRQAAAIRLHFLEEQPLAEIAERLGVGVATVKSYLHQGKPKLRAHFLAAIREYSPDLLDARREAGHLESVIGL